jgi:protein TonB
MAQAELLRSTHSRRHFDVILTLALVTSMLMHAGTLYAIHRWGDCVCHFGKVVCPKEGLDCAPRVNLKLVEQKNLPPPPPAPPKPKPKPAVVVKEPKPERPPASPKIGKVVLPDEAFESPAPPQAEITVDRPTLSEDVVVKESEAEAPVIASGEIFGRADELTAGEPGVFGLGGTGTGVGLGPFGDDEDGGGSAEASTPAPTAPAPPPARAKGPTRNPRVLNWTEPKYPEVARQQGVEGTVALLLTIEADGSLEAVKLAKSSGHSALDDAAAGHVKSLTFSPALKDGEPRAMTIRFKVKFRLVNT